MPPDVVVAKRLHLGTNAQAVVCPRTFIAQDLYQSQSHPESQAA